MLRCQIATAIVAALAVYGCGQGNNRASESAQGGTRNAGWKYTDSVTGLGEHLRFACIQSTNTAKLEWPYGEVRGKLCLRNLDGKLGFAVMTIEGSQIICDQIEAVMCLVPIRCDDQEPDLWQMRQPTDYSTRMVVSVGEGIPLCITTSKTIVVAPTFYQSGRQEFDFESHGFDLKKLGVSGNGPAQGP